MAEITIMKIGSNLIVPIQVELHDTAALRVQQDIMEAIEEKGARGLLIDISKLEVVDSFLGRLIGDTAAHGPGNGHRDCPGRASARCCHHPDGTGP